MKIAPVGCAFTSAWAGQGYGGVQIPRVGDEVVVDFINGEPDQPIVIGRVYNPEASMPPWGATGGSHADGFYEPFKGWFAGQRQRPAF